MLSYLRSIGALALAVCVLWPPVLFAGGAAEVGLSEEKPLMIDGRIPSSGVLSRSPEPPPADLAGVSMLRDRLGIIREIEIKEMSSINRLSRVEELVDAEPVAGPLYLHLNRGSTTVTLQVDPRADTVVLSSPQRELSWSIRREAFSRLDIPLEVAVGSSDSFLPTEQAMEMTLPQPHTQSDVLLDRRTIRTRIKMGYPALTRELGGETFHIRLPEGFNPDEPTGVLVWISPTESGKIPEVLGDACDRIGLVAIGVDNNGNRREITDRLQNHLDSIETLAQHARIDRQRIYLTGMSGGGRCSGILLLAFPDVFAGAVPIVGLDTYHDAPTGKGRQYWPRGLGKPAGKWLRILRDRRIRSITGSADFNEPEMVLRTEMLSADGLEAQIDVIEGMGHTMPSAVQFEEALVWVDEPRQQELAMLIQGADTTLEELESGDVSTPAVRKRLIEILETIPYTPQAWEAAARLGYPDED